MSSCSMVVHCVENVFSQFERYSKLRYFTVPIINQSINNAIDLCVQFPTYSVLVIVFK